MSKKILLNKRRGVDNANINNSVAVNLTATESLLPANSISASLDKYEVYLSERNSTKNYKMSFNIKPYMSNVLFNNFTEIVGRGKNGEQFLVTDRGISGSANDPWVKNSARLYSGYLNREDAIRDSEYSHPEIGNFEYCCGVDIFNNHYLRSNGYFHIRKGVQGDVKISKSEKNNDKVFNTLSDYLVYGDGYIATHKREVPSTSNDPTKTVERQSHLFARENVKKLYDAFYDGIKEENGWVGFYNKCYSSAPNHKIEGEDITINKCLNNKGACEYVDMYPDRTLFSFLPKINRYCYNREEYNWKWMITYPSEKVYEGLDFFEKNKGLKVFGYVREEAMQGKPYVTRDSRFIRFRTKCKHGLNIDDIVKLTYGEKSFSLRVYGLGDVDGKLKEYYFAVSYDDIADEWGEVGIPYGYGTILAVNVPDDIYVAKIIDGVPCDYYVRKFKKIGDLRNSISRAGFARTIYNDQVSQIIFEDNVNIDGLTDHLGREVSELFLTIVKNNVGYEEWYGKGIYGDYSVEASHCFGKVTTGFEFESKPKESVTITSDDFNVRKLFNIEGFSNEEKVKECLKTIGKGNISLPKPLEDKGSSFALQNEFYGDFVEFSPATMEETVLHDVQHRFNTAQREYYLGEHSKFGCNFSTLKEDTIEYDDWDFTAIKNDNQVMYSEENIPNFTVAWKEVNDDMKEYANINLEGYYYKPHHRIQLKEYSPYISKGSDKLILNCNGKNTVKKEGLFTYSITVSVPQHNISTADIVVLYYGDGEYEEYNVDIASSKNTIIFKSTDYNISKQPQKVFLKNRDVPEYAWYTGDGSGKRIWREIIPDTETGSDSTIRKRPFANGSIYVNEDINFYLRRQDPHAEYGLQYTYGESKSRANFNIGGFMKELTNVDYKTEKEYSICKL